MTQTYFDPKRESDPHALPDLEVYLHDARNCPDCGCNGDHVDESTGAHLGCTIDCAGWYWRACLPGCLPDGDPNGPFDTEAEALADAREGMEDGGDEDEEDELEPSLIPHPIQFGRNGELSRDSSGKWPVYADGGYPFLYYTKDGGELCPACANGENGSDAHESHEEAQWKIVGADIYWEGPSVICDHCGEEWESAYGDPDGDPDEGEE